MAAVTDREWRRGHMTAWWVPTIASQAAPTHAEIIAGDELTPHLAAIEGLGFTSQSIEVPNMKTRTTPKIPGADQLSDGTLTIYDNKSMVAGLITTLAKGEAGFIVIGPYEVADPVATDIVEVWPCEVASFQRPYNTNAEGATFQVTVTVTADPHQNAVVA